MDFKAGETGIGELHYGFVAKKEFDIEAERKRIKQQNGHLNRRTEWSSEWNSEGVKFADRRMRYERSYKQFKELMAKGQSIAQAAKKMDKSVGTLRGKNYLRRLQHERKNA